MRTSLLMITINNLKVMFKCINFSLYLMIYIIFYCYKILNASENEKCGKHCFQGTCQINCPQDSRENKKFMVYYGAKSGKEKREKKPHLKIVDGGVAIVSGPAKGKPITVANCGAIEAVHSRIVNGQSAEEGQFPWIAMILRDDQEPHCAATILNFRWLITAAHCFQGMEGYNYSIAVGSIFWRLATRYKVEKFIIHPRYNWEDGMMGCDIALVKTAKPIQQIRQGKKYLINGICLQTKMYQEPKGDELTVAGWGKLAYASDLSNILKAVKLNIINDVECASRYENISHIQGDTFGYTVYRSQICTWSKGKDACEGDSGGPAFEVVAHRAVLIGIVSYGKTCADQYPGVYTQVSFYLDWIASNIH